MLPYLSISFTVSMSRSSMSTCFFWLKIKKVNISLFAFLTFLSYCEWTLRWRQETLPLGWSCDSLVGCSHTWRSKIVIYKTKKGLKMTWLWHHWTGRTGGGSQSQWRVSRGKSCCLALALAEWVPVMINTERRTLNTRAMESNTAWETIAPLVYKVDRLLAESTWLSAMLREKREGEWGEGGERTG